MRMPPRLAWVFVWYAPKEFTTVWAADRSAQRASRLVG